MQHELHLVLGGSGAIGSAVIQALTKQGKTVKVVEKSKTVEGIQTVNANLLDRKQCEAAIGGATHVYLCAGLPYRREVWLRDWPKLMESVIHACSIHNARLIFFDNAYMYGPAPLDVPFDEDHIQAPSTHKGIARKQTSDLLLEAHRSMKVKALIGRSADFYGPVAVNSPFYIKFIENILSHENPQFLGKRNVKHTYAYTEDNGNALVTLALDESSYGQVWHLPVGKPVTVDEVIGIINKILGSNYRVSYIPRLVTGLLSLFMSAVKESREMLYQYDEPYIMSDQKFRKKYPNFVVTPYEKGIRAMIDSMKGRVPDKSNL